MFQLVPPVESFPTYGQLIDILERSSDQDSLLLEVKNEFPLLQNIGRPGRFFNTVQRIAAPTLSSTLGSAKLAGSPLKTYRKRVWEPRTRNVTGSTPG